jgi:hypothetical protein
METVKQAFAEVTTAFESLQHKRDEALHRCAELEVLLDAERSSSTARESQLVDANSRLLAQVEELSLSVARAQAQVCFFRPTLSPPPPPAFAACVRRVFPNSNCSAPPPPPSSRSLSSRAAKTQRGWAARPLAPPPLPRPLRPRQPRPRGRPRPARCGPRPRPGRARAAAAAAAT